ncbi:unnamed protein product [Tetraodon nigroviridis]|uniref:Calmodulin-lysine N-methyltransferase n=1 Tax=Tetraodon nigroviridis TaxID=99883 RepID=Q4SQK5_TETNG|nr:unnamed protein product [Tetraodon nigroviridis]
MSDVRELAERNGRAGKFGSTRVSARVVRWDCESDVSPLEGHFDTILCADCLFLDQYRACLVDAIRRLLQPNGTALVFAPMRGKTLGLFCQLAQQAGLDVSQQQQYDARVTDVHVKMLKRGREAYDEDIHYPLLITLTKGPQLSKPQDGAILIPPTLLLVALMVNKAAARHSASDSQAPPLPHQDGKRQTTTNHTHDFISSWGFECTSGMEH